MQKLAALGHWRRWRKGLPDQASAGWAAFACSCELCTVFQGSAASHCSHAKERILESRRVPHRPICWQSTQIECTAKTHSALFLLPQTDPKQCSEQHSMQLTNLHLVSSLNQPLPVANILYTTLNIFTTSYWLSYFISFVPFFYLPSPAPKKNEKERRRGDWQK